jgi:hypothetical protein
LIALARRLSPQITINQSAFAPTEDEAIKKVRELAVSELNTKIGNEVSKYACKRSTKFTCFISYECIPTKITPTGPEKHPELRPEDRYYYALVADYELNIWCKGFKPEEIKEPKKAG